MKTKVLLIRTNLPYFVLGADNEKMHANAEKEINEKIDREILGSDWRVKTVSTTFVLPPDIQRDILKGEEPSMLALTTVFLEIT